MTESDELTSYAKLYLGVYIYICSRKIRSQARITLYLIVYIVIGLCCFLVLVSRAEYAASLIIIRSHDPLY